MASRLLHRLRHALTGDGPGEAAAGPEAEQFPESSELEDDDAEGLSSRLSGTLSFTSAEDDEDQDDEDDEEADPDPLPDGDRAAGEDAGPSCAHAERSPPTDGQQGSQLLTRQLQDFWKKSRNTLVPQRLLFEVTSANVVKDPPSKYVETGCPTWTDLPNPEQLGRRCVPGRGAHFQGSPFATNKQRLFIQSLVHQGSHPQSLPLGRDSKADRGAGKLYSEKKGFRAVSSYRDLAWPRPFCIFQAGLFSKLSCLPQSPSRGFSTPLRIQHRTGTTRCMKNKEQKTHWEQLSTKVLCHCGPENKYPLSQQVPGWIAAALFVL
ncbi:sorting nexin-21 isoform X5 [Physeter macrocephalus]|uniref:Sorting nexin-21 isoform X5 n=1 Tax=Physeter macrocephalus TaxID=9755 RepID=A0A9W2WG87_PHYMC|nr:sorting nexin-21 isoform X5 [Physeter catodon]